MIPLWVQIAYTAMAALVLPVYWVRYGWRNYLWFSDVALIGMLPALLLESAFLVSMLAVGMLALELLWNVSFFTQLLTGWGLSGLTDYMFEARRPLYLRALSLFHVVVPAAMIFALLRLDYDPSAFPAMIVLSWVVLLATYLLTDPEDNINWVRKLGARPPTKLSPRQYLAALMVGFPLLVHLPTHLVLSALSD